MQDQLLESVDVREHWIGIAMHAAARVKRGPQPVCSESTLSLPETWRPSGVTMQVQLSMTAWSGIANMDELNPAVTWDAYISSHHHHHHVSA